MSLICCNGGLQRTDSDSDSNSNINTRFNDTNDNKPSSPKSLSSILRRKLKPERTWSGNLLSRSFNKGKSSTGDDSSSKHHRRYGSTGAVGFNVGDEDDEPKLVRSGGLRRDWSFENLYAQQRDEKRSKLRR